MPPLFAPPLDCDRLFWGNCDSSGNTPGMNRFNAILEGARPGESHGYICDGSYKSALKTFGYASDVVVWLEPGAITRTTRVMRRTCANVVDGESAFALATTTADAPSLLQRVRRVAYQLLWDVDASIIYSAAGINRHRPNIIANLLAFTEGCAEQTRERRQMLALAMLYETGTNVAQKGPTKKEKAAKAAAKKVAAAAVGPTTLVAGPHPRLGTLFNDCGTAGAAGPAVVEEIPSHVRGAGAESGPWQRCKVPARPCCT